MATKTPATIPILNGKVPELSVLSFGAGQDSSALLHLYLRDRNFRQKYAPKRLIVTYADTLDEHPDTNEYVATDVQDICRRNGLQFFHITPDQGYHAGAWRGGLLGQYRANHTIGSTAYPATCSTNLKIAPIWFRIEDIIAKDYGYTLDSKRGLRAFTEEHGAINCLIGFAAGEEKRAGRAAEADKPKEAPLVLPFGVIDKDAKAKKKTRTPLWMRECVNRLYPLIDLGMNRQGCQDYIHSINMPLPAPSNCVRCFFKSHQEVLWTYRRYPEMYAEWEQLEREKLAHWEGRTDEHGVLLPNLGVKGKKLLSQFLAEALALYGDWTLNELDEYRMSHGHCVKSMMAVA